MNSNLKSRRRLLIVLGVSGGLVAVAVGGYFVRKQQVAGRILAGRNAGAVALAAGKYFEAMHAIGPYVNKHPQDVAAILDYAQARQNVIENNGRHITDSISLYRRVLELQPDNAEARRNLLELYVRAGFNTEILALTENADDIDSIRARAIALSKLGRHTDAAPLFDQYFAQRPNDLEIHLFKVAFLQNSGKTGAELIDYVNTVAAANPASPAMALLQAYGHLVAGDRDAARKFTLAAVDANPTSPFEIELGVDLLDELDEFPRSLEFLNRVAALNPEPRFQLRVVSRLFQSGQFEQLLARFPVDQAKADSADASLLAHQAMALIRLDRRDEARQIVAQLRNRKGDIPAAAWATLLGDDLDPTEVRDEAAIIQAANDGLREDPNNPYFRLRLGDAYQRLGETELAVREWARSSQAARAWATPIHQMLPVAIENRELQIASVLADRLEKIDPRGADSLAFVAAVRAATLDRGNAAALQSLRDSLERIQTLKPGHPGALQLQISMLAALDGPDAARDRVEAMLAQRPPLPADALQALARAIENTDPALARRCIDLAIESNGISVDLATAQALIMIRAGETAKAVDEFKALRARSAGNASLAWSTAEAVVLDAAGNPDARSTWIRLADENPKAINIQRLAISSSTVRNDLAFLGRAIERIKAVIGNEGVNVRVAEASLILRQAADMNAQNREREVVRAASMLSDIVRQFPDKIEARQLLANSLVLLDRRIDAIGQFVEIVRRSPQSRGAILQLVQLLQHSGDFDRARPYLDQAESLIEQQRALGIDDELRDDAVRLAALLRAQGLADRALAVLQKFDDAAGSTTVAAHELLAAQGRLDEATIKSMLAEPTLTNVELVAEHYARLGRLSEADAVIEKLGLVDAAAGEREFARGLYYQRRGRHAEAIPEFRVAADALPDKRNVWAALLVSQIAEGRSDDVLATLARAKSALPNDEGFKRLGDSALVKSAVENPVLRPLLVDLLGATDSADDLMAALRLADSSAKADRTIAQVLEDLRPIAQRMPRQRSVQFLLIDLELAAGQVDRAIAAASRLAQVLPADPAPARRLSEICFAAGRWNELINAANDWKRRSGAATRDADEYLATGLLGTNRAAEALAVAETHYNPAVFDNFARLRMQSLIALNRTADAETAIFPQLTQSPLARSAAITACVTQFTDAATINRWMNAVEAAVPTPTLSDQIVLLQAWNDLAQRNITPAFADQVMRRLDSVEPLLQAATDATASNWFVFALISEINGRDAQAAAAYRKALELDPSLAVASNNLAMLLLRTGGSLDEALRLARQATSATNDRNIAEYFDSLGQVQLKLSDYTAARQSLQRAVELDPASIEKRIRLTRAIIGTGDGDAARAALTELRTLAQRGGNPKYNDDIAVLVDDVRSMP